MKHTIIIRLVLFLLLLSLTPITPGQKALPARTAASNPVIERRINALVARMTPAEKLGQLQQLDGEADGKYRPEHLEMARKGLLGSTLNVRGAAMTNELQRAASSLA